MGLTKRKKTPTKKPEVVKKITLGEKRKDFHNFLSTNIITRSIKQEDNQFKFNYQKNKFNINAISKDGDLDKILNYEFYNDSRYLDNDRRKLIAKYEALVDYVIKENEEGIVPGFIFLRPDIDFNQVPLAKRVTRIVNPTGFGKQQLQNKYSSIPFNDARKLSQSELVVWALHLHTKESENKTINIPQKGTYLLGTNYYNFKEKRVEEYAFRHTGDYKKYKITNNCVWCNKGNKEVDHQECKESSTYKLSAMQRKEARQFKDIIIPKKRFPKIKNSRNTDDGVRFIAIELDKEKIQPYSSQLLKDRPYYIALIK